MVSRLIAVVGVLALRPPCRTKHLSLMICCDVTSVIILSITQLVIRSMVKGAIDLSGFRPGTETKRKVWLLRTGFGIAPVNKLVSLTWLLWALRSFRSFTLHYIYAYGSTLKVRCPERIWGLKILFFILF